MIRITDINGNNIYINPKYIYLIKEGDPRPDARKVEQVTFVFAEGNTCIMTRISVEKILELMEEKV